MKREYAQPAVVLRRFALWLLACSVAAAPSFLIAMDGFNVFGMITGVLLFVILLTALTTNGWYDRIAAFPRVRVTLRIGYVLRMVVSVVFPVGFAVDMISGMISVSIVDGLTGGDSLSSAGETGFWPTLAMTIVQGTILNTLILILCTAVWLVQRPWRLPRGETLCRCGYDLRGSGGGKACPECGRQVTEEIAAAIATLHEQQQAAAYAAAPAAPPSESGEHARHATQPRS